MKEATICHTLAATTCFAALDHKQHNVHLAYPLHDAPAPITLLHLSSMEVKGESWKNETYDPYLGLSLTNFGHTYLSICFTSSRQEPTSYRTQP